jgi:CheY-like chemotaxis protein
MQSTRYQLQELTALLKSLETDKFSGALHIKSQINTGQRSRILIFKVGQIVYGGNKIPQNIDFFQAIGQKLQSKSMKVAIEFAKQKVINPNSFGDFLDIFTKMRLFKWEDLEKLICTQTAIVLEQLLPYPGEIRYDTAIDFDLCYGDECKGLDSSLLNLELERRQQEWRSLAPTITSMEMVPCLSPNALENISDLTVRQHLKQWVDGARSLVDIGESLDKDPLQIARSYLTIAQSGWIVFNSNTVSISSQASTVTTPSNVSASVAPKSQDLPTILAVDDSPVMQVTIKRALNAQYQVLIASSAIEALNLLQNNSVSLILLDVSMPDIDGLELCRTIRKMPQYRDLPIIMLTAKDGLVDKLKGQIAGSTQYLTKPFNNQKLLDIVGGYLKVIKG